MSSAGDVAALKAVGRAGRAARGVNADGKAAAAPAAADVTVDTKKKAALKPRAKRAAPKSAPMSKKAKATPGSDSDATMDEAEAPVRRGAVGSGRAAAQGAVYEDAPALGAAGDDTVALKDVAHAESEAAALVLLGAGGEPGGAYAAFDVVAFSSADEKAHLHTAPFADPPVFVSAVVARSATERGGGFAVASIGPVTGFAAVVGGAAPLLTFSTAAATYVLRKPAAGYKKVHTHLAEQAELAHEARAALADLGADADFAAVCARLTRKRPAAVAAYGTAARALGACGHFVRDALAAADAAAGTAHATGAFGAALVDAVARARADLAGGATGIVIKDDPAPVAAAGKGKAAVAATKGKGKAAAAGAAAVVAPLPSLTPAALRERADADLSVQLEIKQRVKEVEKAATGGVKTAAPKSGAYYQISESEIADDYPPPSVFDAPAADQMDELLLADEDTVAAGPDALPTCLLTDFAVYDSEGFLKSLELLPLWSGVQPDVELFATGAVTQLAGGDGYEEAAELVKAAAAGAGGSGSGSGAASSGPYLALSAIQEWVLEAGGDRVDVLIRTDVAWYRLVTPSKAYAPYMDVVAKAGAVALALWKAIEGGENARARAARLSLDDAAKVLAALPADDPAFVSAKPADVARFLAVHGQILLTQFAGIEAAARVKGLTKSPVATALLARLAERRHTVLYRSSGKPKKGAAKRLRANPLKDRSTGRKAAPMTATATAMVRFVWQSYFKGAGAPGPDEAADAAAVDDDVNADDGDDDAAEDALASPAPAARRAPAPKKGQGKAVLVGAASKGVHGASVYGGATVGPFALAPGDVVELAPAADAAPDSDADDAALEPVLGVVQALFTAAGDATPRLQARVAVRGADTVLGDAASDAELFITTALVTRPLADVVDKLDAARRARAWRAADRRAHLAEDTALSAANAAAAAAGRPLAHFYRSFYEPERGMFRVAEEAELRAGELLPEAGPAPAGVRAGPAPGTFTKDGVTIAVGDAVFLPPDAFEGAPAAAAKKGGGAKKRGKRAPSDESDLSDEDAPAAPAPKAKPAKAKPGSRSKFHKGGANVGLRAYAIGLVTAIPSSGGRSGPAAITVTRYARPEDVSDELGYAADWWDVYATNQSVTIATASVVGRASIVAPDGVAPGDNVFACRGTVDLATKKVTPPPAGLAKEPAGGDARRAPLPTRPASKSQGDGVSLATMDIFAGCGGLSEGMHLAGAAHPKWAIEYEAPAAEAYKLNNPDATTFVDNCNVILAAAMRKAGCGDDCEASESCMEAVEAMDKAVYAALPAPGDVEFLCGGPPCQGYSGMNRFNKGNWSMVQNSMVMSYLSFADFYRPRYFLLENVRNFVSHNKSFTFRLTLRSLLEMGYSVRFGVLNAGNFGVSQSRKRTFIWAAAPGDALPDWPAPRHVFKSPQLTINLPGGVAYTAVRQTVGAPVRAVTVRDAIGDLPPVTNGEDAAERPYAGPAQSAFQRAIRGGNAVLYDHVCKTMNDLNMARCRCIPKGVPGADWRVLKTVIADDEAAAAAGKPRAYPGGHVVVAGKDHGALIPWCLPNTEDRHNGWRGLFGRLDPAGHFPTSTTDPQPMGKVGQVFHPTQDRIVSVRECARAQGFPDAFRLWGNVHQKHRQVGNAVPVPLAAALGKQLRAALEETAAKRGT